ncbi:Fe-S cluster assembly sulfur transfer protein SufU [Dietzia sp. ANT_WB102]|uniref:Fe-S cluster assembly sulfur transfer protein SufU n=1 Tax=Dietzia sp. ANT_WB102 TaxID=2597345 RepID=UPI0011F06312|nr:SUF system NifU family Fe-S cluster assembly protein [Dietzia sp. ANT_WB102]KAA0919685.1 SUF system NifU family Fe-S cluster assembly protein [Dietzia sp. ANT_WB102]
MKLEQMYQEVILDHYRHPHHSGLREPFGAEVHHVNPTCGDELTLRLQLSDDLAIVEDVSYDAQGCSISQASTSMMADLLVGRPVPESMEILDAFQSMISSRGQNEGNEELLDDAVALSGVSRYPARVKCALLGWMAFKDALTQQTDQHQE